MPLRTKTPGRVYPKYYLFEKKKKNLTVCLRDTTSVPRIVSGCAAIWLCTCNSRKKDNAHALRDDVKARQRLAKSLLPGLRGVVVGVGVGGRVGGDAESTRKSD